MVVMQSLSVSRLLRRSLVLAVLFGCFMVISHQDPFITKASASDPWDDFYACSDTFNNSLNLCEQNYQVCYLSSTTQAERIECGIELGGCGGTEVIEYQQCLGNYDDAPPVCPERQAAAQQCESDKNACEQAQQNTEEDLGCSSAYTTCRNASKIDECE